MIIKSLKEMRDFAFDFAKKLKPGQVINLIGDMGAGKTTFVSFIGEYLEVFDTSSPTFAIVNIYNAKEFDIYHLDLYRFEDEDDILDIDFETYFYPEDAISFIEWADRAKSYLPDGMVEVRIKKINETTRDISVDYDRR